MKLIATIVVLGLFCVAPTHSVTSTRNGRTLPTLSMAKTSPVMPNNDVKTSFLRDNAMLSTITSRIHLTFDQAKTICGGTVERGGAICGGIVKRGAVVLSKVSKATMKYKSSVITTIVSIIVLYLVKCVLTRLQEPAPKPKKAFPIATDDNFLVSPKKFYYYAETYGDEPTKPSESFIEAPSTIVPPAPPVAPTYTPPSPETVKQVEDILNRSKIKEKKWSPNVMAIGGAIPKPKPKPKGLFSKVIKKTTEIAEAVDPAEAVELTVDPAYQALMEEENASFSFEDNGKERDSKKNAQKATAPVIEIAPSIGDATVEILMNAPADAVEVAVYALETAIVEVEREAGVRTSDTVEGEVASETNETPAREDDDQRLPVVDRSVTTVETAAGSEEGSESNAVIVSDEGSAGALFAGVVAGIVMGPTVGIALAVTSAVAASKDNDSGEAIRGVGKNVMGAVQFIDKVNKKRGEGSGGMREKDVDEIVDAPAALSDTEDTAQEPATQTNSPIE